MRCNASASLKLTLIFLPLENSNKAVLIQFGLPAVLFAAFGSWLLLNISGAQPLFSYELLGKTFQVFPVKLMISILLIAFASIDLIPYFNNLQFGKSKLPIGGAISGFFGGLSGNQGALRSAFLIKAGLSKEAFIGTAVVVSTFVDMTRLSIYATQFTRAVLDANLTLVISATLAGILGSFFGNRLIRKVTLQGIKIMVSIMLIVLSVALGAGWV
jgi:uncharacterized membrane protein YfcA